MGRDAKRREQKVSRKEVAISTDRFGTGGDKRSERQEKLRRNGQSKRWMGGTHLGEIALAALSLKS